MTVRTKTTHWGLAPCDTATVASGATRTFSATTIYVPETTSRAFKAAIVEVCFSGLETTATSISAVTAGLTVNVTRTTDVITGTLTNSGENQGGVLQFDFTAGVEANFGAGASQDFTFDIVITGVDTNNVSASLALTYDYADSAATQCKTYMNALQVTNTFLNTSSGSYGNIVNYLTGANGVLKEASITIRDYYFVIEGNENGNGGTTDFALNVRLDSDGYTTFGTIERALGSDKMYRYIWSKKGAVPDTEALHSFSAYCATQSHHCLSLVLVVTYEFDVATTTVCTNSLQIPFRVGPYSGTTVGDAMVARIELDIEEPETITAKTSSIKMYFATLGAMTGSNVLRVVAGAESERQYTNATASGSVCGSIVLSQAGYKEWARGKNYYDIFVYLSSSYSIYNFSGILYVNYTSGIASTGIGSHNHTVYYHHASTNYSNTAPYTEYAAKVIAPIGDTAYWLQGLGTWAWQYIGSTSQLYDLELMAETLSGEDVGALGDGWKRFAYARVTPNSETGSFGLADFEQALFKRHPADPRVGAYTLTASRKLREYSIRWTGAITFMAVYHSITFTKTGNVTGYAGTGAVTVNIHDATSGEKLYTVTASAGGAYSVTMYDSSRDHYSEVYEDATHVGRSSNWKAA